MTYLIKTKFEITACETCPCFDSEWSVCNLTGTDTYTIEICYWEEKLPDCPLEAVEAMDIIESEDVAPVVHAHKVRAHSQGGGTHWVVCSNCEQPIDWQDVYCKHCGAKMDGKE